MNSLRSAVHSTFFSTLDAYSVMLRPYTGSDHAHSDCSQAATSYHHCAESRPASCSHWRSHKRCTVVSAFAVERHRHGMRRGSMREKLACRMTFARAAHACTKRDAQAYLEQFHQPRTTCAVAQRSATSHRLRHVCTTAAVVQLHRARRL